MVGVEFGLFVPTAISQSGGSYTIAVLRKSHAEIIFMKTCLMVKFLFILVMVKFPYPPFPTHQS